MLFLEQIDNFENPYAVRNFPQQPQQQPQQLPPYQQGYPGVMGRRRKRELKNYEWGIHRLMSTGNKMTFREMMMLIRLNLRGLPTAQ